MKALLEDNPLNKAMDDLLTKTFRISADELKDLKWYFGSKGAAEIPMIGPNQPTFVADAPWRIEADQDRIPILLIIHEGNINTPKGSFQLRSIKITHLRGGQPKEFTISAGELNGLYKNGKPKTSFWTHALDLYLDEADEKHPKNKYHLEGVKKGSVIYLRVEFIGSFPGKPVEAIPQYLRVFWSESPLPLGRADQSVGSRQWFYGDTHYHSAYTNDIKEFGNPLPESLSASKAIGLDWLVITDHSCDLDEKDGGNQTRWERLKKEINVLSDCWGNDFRCILGEEVTVESEKENGFLHLLAIGNLDELLPGGFLPADGGVWEIWRKLLRFLQPYAKKQGYSSHLTDSLLGKILPLNEVLDRFPADTLAFSAHPYTIAQIPPAKWTSGDLLLSRLNGYEFWNGRERRGIGKEIVGKVDLTNLTEMWEKPNDLEGVCKSKIAELKGFASDWEEALKAGVKDWKPEEKMPPRRPVFIGGTDAHGSFNSTNASFFSWDYNSEMLHTDNALGRVRTAVYLHTHQANTVPEIKDILSALKNGSCIVTDGPVVEFTLGVRGRKASLGGILDNIRIDGNISLDIKVHTSIEFGSVEVVNVIVFDYLSSTTAKEKVYEVKLGEKTTLGTLMGRGYCRVFAQTRGPAGELFCCFTNPIWYRLGDGKSATLVVNCTQAG